MKSDVLQEWSGYIAAARDMENQSNTPSVSVRDACIRDLAAEVKRLRAENTALGEEMEQCREANRQGDAMRRDLITKLKRAEFNLHLYDITDERIARLHARAELGQALMDMPKTWRLTYWPAWPCSWVITFATADGSMSVEGRTLQETICKVQEAQL